MKKTKVIIYFLILSFLFPLTTFAGTPYKCANLKGKLSKCDVYVKDGHLHVEYKKKKEQKLNRVIDGKMITKISQGEYARRRIAEGIGFAFLAPVALFALLSKKKRDSFAVEYTTANKNKDVVFFQTKKKYSHFMKSKLEAISGKKVILKESKKSKKNSKKN